VSGVFQSFQIQPNIFDLLVKQQLKQQLKVMNADGIPSAFICVYLLKSAVKKTPNPTT
jgi:hypothetical protein